MDLNEYTKLAVRTESDTRKVITDKESLITLLHSFTLMGELLDAHKKYIFYSKTPDGVKFKTNALALSNILSQPIENPATSDEREWIHVNERIFHSILGVVTEAAEMVEILLDNLVNGKELDIKHLDEEFNDLNWYPSLFYDETGIDRVESLKRNLEKLRARFPEKFTSENAINRDLGKEKKILGR